MKIFMVILAMAGLAGGGAVKVAESSSRAIAAGPLSISEAGRDLIVEFETGGRAEYERKLKSPEWPGGASGVTIGIGYDLGYKTAAQIRTDWAELPDGTREALAAAAGIKGANAKTRAKALKWVVVPWERAEGVFVGNTMPRFGKLTVGAFPAVPRHNGDVQGGLLSIVFNRGSAMSGDGRREMRAIRDDLEAGRVNDVPVQIRLMKRLWVGKGLDGLLRRREAEARLIEGSLK